MEFKVTRLERDHWDGVFMLNYVINNASLSLDQMHEEAGFI